MGHVRLFGAPGTYDRWWPGVELDLREVGLSPSQNDTMKKNGPISLYLAAL